VNGVSEFAQMVRAGTRVKPVTAYVGGMAASGGYWIASAASSILVADTAVLGSIGVVVGMYVEDDETYVEIVSTQSPGKRPNVRTTEGRAQIQSDVDALANVFINTVARNRSVMAERVLSDFGRGGVLIGQAAVDAGMADGVSTLEALIAQRARKPEPPRPTDPADPRARLPPAAELIMSYGHDAALALLGKRIAAERAKQ
jgi:ClpP class serine protease